MVDSVQQEKIKMSNVNHPEVIKYVLNRYHLREAGVISCTNGDIAKEVNATFGVTHHTEDSVRGIFRRHSSKIEETVSVSRPRYGSFVPLELDEPNVLIIPDLHIPFMEKGFLAFLKEAQEFYESDTVICIGDVVDQCALSFFDKNPNGMSAGNELEKTRQGLKQLVSLFPNVYVTIGNHDNRHLRSAMKAGIPPQYMKDFLEVFDVPDTWKWNHSYILNGETLVEHGSEGGLMATYGRAWGTGLNVIQGHTHAYGGVLYMNDGLKSRWAMNVGCGIDINAYAFDYAATKRNKPTLGCGILTGNVPLFLPYAQ